MATLGSRCRRLRDWRRIWRCHPRLFRCGHRRLHRIDHRLGGRQLDRVVPGTRPAHRRRAARQPTHHLLDRRGGDPAAVRPDADWRQHHLGDRFPRGNPTPPVKAAAKVAGAARSRRPNTSTSPVSPWPLCEGEITGIGRVWADGKAMDMTGVTWRWYPGDESADRLIRSSRPRWAQ